MGAPTKARAAQGRSSVRHLPSAKGEDTLALGPPSVLRDGRRTDTCPDESVCRLADKLRRNLGQRPAMATYSDSTAQLVRKFKSGEQCGPQT